MKQIPAGRLFILLLALILVMAYGCKTPPQVARTDTIREIITREVIRDTTIYMTDSAGLYALLYCDSIGQVHVRQIEQFYAGQFIRPKVEIRNNYLKADCRIDSAAVSIRWTETHSTETATTTQVIVKEVKYIPGYAYACIYFTLLALIAGIVAGVYFAIKSSNIWLVLITWAGKLIAKIFKKK